jgi:hypothetical protein
MLFLKCCRFEGSLIENATCGTYALTYIILLFTWALYVVWYYVCKESGSSNHSCNLFKVSGSS